MNLLPFLIFKPFFFLTLCCLYSWQAHALTLTPEEQEWITQNPTVTLGSDYAWPPYDFIDSQNQHAGISADIIEIIRQKTGLDIQIKSGVWSDIMTEMKAGQLDGLVCAVKTSEREAYLNFTPPYITMPLVIIVRSDNTAITSIADLKDTLVAVNKGSYLHEWLQTHYPDIPLYLTDSNKNSLDAVSFGKVKAYVGNLAVATYLIKQHYLTNLKVVAQVEELETKTAIAIDKNNPMLMAIIQKALSNIDSLVIRRINEKWHFQSQANTVEKVTLTAKERKWMDAYGAINVASETDWPPFNFVDMYQNPVGLSMDYLTLITQKTGLEWNVVMDSWDKNLSKLKNKQTDLLPSGVKTKEREGFAVFSESYFEASHYFFVRDDLKVQEIKELDGKVVAIPKGFASIKLIRTNYPHILVLETESMQEAIEAVIQNKAQLLYGLYPAVSYALRKTGVNTIMPFKATPKGAREVRFILRNDQPELLSIINKGLAAISQAEKEQIYAKWIAKRPNIVHELEFELTKVEQDWLKNNSTIRFAGDPDWLPFEGITKNGEYTGIVAEFLTEVELRLPVQFNPVSFASWQDTLKLAAQQKVDVISGDVEDVNLAQNYRPIEPYIKAPIVIVMGVNAEFVNSLDELQKQSLAIVKGYGYTHALLNAFPDHQFVEFDTPIQALESISLGKNDAAVLSFPVASYLIKQHGFHHLKIVGKTALEMNVTLFVSKELPILHQLLNRVMQQVSEERGGEIFNNWTKLSFASKADYWLIFQVVLAALLLMGVVFYWNLKLAKEIKQRKAIEQQLNTEKDKFKHLFEKATDGHLIYQRGKFVACNQAALTLLGLTDKEALLNQDVENWSPEYQKNGELSTAKRKQLIQNCFNQGMQRFDWMLKDIYGHVFWVDVVYTSIPYLGKPAIYISWRDKTEQKALEETLKQNEAQLKRLIDSIPLIVIVTDFEGNILNANRKAMEDYQVTTQEVLQLNITHFYQNSKDREALKKILQAEGRVDQKIIKMKDFQGKAREMMLSIIPVKYHNQSALLTISVDLTERIAAEKQLKVATERAEAANHSKTEFLANMSHEIRTPMNAILGFTELLNEQVKEPRLKSFISTIQSAGNTLLMLINDILDLSKIEAGKMTLNKIATNPHELFNEVSDIFSMNIQKKGLDFYIEIDPDIPQSVLLDPVRLRQVLFNLLGNAVKFTEAGFVKLSVQSLAVFDHLSKMNLLIKVEDTGIGIPLEQQDRIFNVFEQQEGQDSGKFGGTGLGLSITKRLVSMMQGHLSVESVPNQGSTFSILLEKLDVASVHTHSTLEVLLPFNAKAIHFKAVTILVVDDIVNNRELICQNFIGTGIEVIQAENGQQAIEQYKKHPIDLILMDIRMPVLNGYEAAKVIKSLNPTIPIIALTASVMQDEFEKIRRTYFDDYLRKPVLRNNLIQALTQFLEYDEAEPEANKPSEAVLFDFSESLVQQMNEQFGELYAQAVESNSLEDIKAFSCAIASFADKHDNTLLAQFASQLLEKIDSFDISGMQFLLKQYESATKNKEA
ncbi:Virulence sensor protein bvgS precursor [hydrothermal vent metagenome]|uniref:histidine kinase n=1 Tax=hydrothermal vent metagenome TaxID=652676 RepID=A0A3B0VPR2_9ZZZZ